MLARFELPAMAEAWRMLVGLIVVVGMYALAVGVLGAPASPAALLSLVIFGGAGLLAGQYISNRMDSD
jgi:hypothetical protein